MLKGMCRRVMSTRGCNGGEHLSVCPGSGRALPHRRTMEASAVCRYSISAVQHAFEGPYMEYQDSARKWSRYDGVVPEPRPGSVSAQGCRAGGWGTVASPSDPPSPLGSASRTAPAGRVTTPRRTCPTASWTSSSCTR